MVCENFDFLNLKLLGSDQFLELLGNCMAELNVVLLDLKFWAVMKLILVN